jgi:hypothetical protein
VAPGEQLTIRLAEDQLTAVAEQGSTADG